MPFKKSSALPNNLLFKDFSGNLRPSVFAVKRAVAVVVMGLKNRQGCHFTTIAPLAKVNGDRRNSAGQDISHRCRPGPMCMSAKQSDDLAMARKDVGQFADGSPSFVLKRVADPDNFNRRMMHE